jgi:hypothetical protein
MGQKIEDSGLGPFLDDDRGDRFYLMHDGANEGYRSVLAAYPKRGQDVVIMTNADSNATRCVDTLEWAGHGQARINAEEAPRDQRSSALVRVP